MLYLIGGGPRVGKSTVASMLAGRLGCNCFALDLLRETLKLADSRIDEFSWQDARSMAEHADRFRPFLVQFLGMANVSDDYVVEGLELTPPVIAGLRESFPLRSVVLGNSRPDLSLIREWGGRWGSWLEDLGVEDRERFPEQLRVRSVELAVECARMDVAFVDTAPGFDEAVAECVELLLDGRAGAPTGQLGSTAGTAPPLRGVTS